MEEKHLIEMGIVIGRRLKFLKVLASLKSKSRYEEREKSLLRTTRLLHKLLELLLP